MSVSQIGGAGGDTVTDCITVHVSERGWLYILLVGLTASVNEIGCIYQRGWLYLSAELAVFISGVGCIC